MNYKQKLMWPMTSSKNGGRESLGYPDCDDRMTGVNRRHGVRSYSAVTSLLTGAQSHDFLVVVYAQNATLWRIYGAIDGAMIGSTQDAP